MMQRNGATNRATGGAARRLGAMLAAGVVAAACALPAMGQEVKASGRVGMFSESAYAAELWRLNQVSLIKAEAAKPAKAGTGRGDVESLWKAQLLRVTWAEATKTRADLKRGVEDYVRAANAYMDSVGQLKVPVKGASDVKEIPDGFWAADQVNFIFSDMAQNLVSRMEYNGISDRDREELAPIAKLAMRVCDAAEDGLRSVIEVEGDRIPFNDAADAPYARASDAMALPQYYRNFALYYTALATDPATAGGTRRDALNKAIKQLGEDWIDAEEAVEKLVKTQAHLLRGKCYSELGNFPAALKDFAAAQDPKNAKDGKLMPETVFQSQYQSVVTHARARDWEKARGSLDSLRKSPMITSKPAEEQQAARLMLDLLKFRVDWMEAEAKPDNEKREARLAALRPLADVVAKAPESHRAFVYESLLSQISAKDEAAAAGAGASDVLPLQALAMGWSRFQQARTAEPARKALLLGEATRLVDRVRKATVATPTEKLEATWVAALSALERGDAEATARLCLDYAETAPPDDKRTKTMAEEAQRQLAELRKKNNNVLAPELQPLANRLVAVMDDKLKDVRWAFARGLTYLKKFEALRDRERDTNLLKLADDSFNRVQVDSPFYMESRFQSLYVTALAMQELQRSKGKAEADLAAAKDDTAKRAAEKNIAARELAVRDAATRLLKACEKFRETVKSPPQGVTPDAIKAAQERMVDVAFQEIAVCLDPLQDGARAVRLLEQVEKDLGESATEAQQASILQLRIRAYTLKNEGGEAVRVAKAYVAKVGDKATGTIQQLVLKWETELGESERVDPKKAKVLAGQLVELIKALIDMAQERPAADAKAEEAKKLQIYRYKQYQGRMMVTGTLYDRALEHFAALEKERPRDAANELWVAHALFGKGKFQDAQQKYVELIKRLSPETNAWWTCYLRMIMANEELMKDPNDPNRDRRKADNVDTLKNLKAVYTAERLGGTELHQQFLDLLKTYNLE